MKHLAQEIVDPKKHNHKCYLKFIIVLIFQCFDAIKYVKPIAAVVFPPIIFNDLLTPLLVLVPYWV
jgi:hypothetical protein